MLCHDDDDEFLLGLSLSEMTFSQKSTFLSTLLFGMWEGAAAFVYLLPLPSNLLPDYGASKTFSRDNEIAELLTDDYFRK